MAVQETIAARNWQQTGCFFAGVWLVYIVALVVWRLWFSPLAHIPGPKLAALTQYYEFYYDFVLGGQYNYKIIDMHERYGPIVRINPWEVHVGDPEFFSDLYTSPSPSRRRDKWTFYTQQVNTLCYNRIKTATNTSLVRCSSYTSSSSKRSRSPQDCD